MNFRTVGVVGLLFGMGILFYFLMRSAPPGDLFVSYFIPGMFFAMGIGTMLVVIYTNFDQKDHWNIWLPYNHKLFNRLNKKIRTMFEEKGYNIKEDSVEANGVSSTFKIKPSIVPELTVYYGLEIIHGKYTTTYQFPMKIKNIRKDNLIYAHQLQKDLHDILTRIEYRSYPDEGKSFPI